MNSYLERIAEEAANGKSPAPVTTREFLSWFGAQRRGYWIVRSIRKDLEDAGLQTVPDFESNFIDAPLELHRVVASPPKVDVAAMTQNNDIDVPSNLDHLG